jgi:geranylgeranyl diphosphate synthase, type II
MESAYTKQIPIVSIYMPTAHPSQLPNLLAGLSTTISNLPLSGSPAEVYEPMRYLLSLPAKRLRPTLVLLAAKLVANETTDLNPQKESILSTETDFPSYAYNLAAAVEVFHNFTLMHDDIMDRAALRRGQPTVHTRWNEATAILSGDGMLVKTYQVLLEASPPHLLPTILARFNQAALQVVEGQQYDMNYELLPLTQVPSEEDYLEMIRLKTAVLLGFSMWLGGTIGGASPQVCDQLDQAGQELGLGFQLHDDYLDLFGDPSQVGKTLGGDVRAGKKTFLLVHALAHSSQKVSEAIHMHYGMQNTETVSIITECFNQTNSGAACNQLSERRYQKGIDLLHKAATNLPALEEMETLIRQVMERQF